VTLHSGEMEFLTCPQTVTQPYKANS